MQRTNFLDPPAALILYAVLCRAVLCSGLDSAPDDLPSTISQLLSTALTSGDAEAATYWAYHLVRTGFFTATVGATPVA